MGARLKYQRSPITQLPDDSLYLIFEKLETKLDRESFGLTCHQFLDIQSSSLKYLKLKCYPCLSHSSRIVSIDSSMLVNVLNRFKQLKSLSLSGCIDVSDLGLTRLQNYGSKLHSLYLNDVYVTNKGLYSIASGFPLLSVISLPNCKISDNGLKVLSKSCKYLKELDLFRCDKITDTGIRYLNQNCPRLRKLNISLCHKVVGVGFQGCSPTLACLDANTCLFSSSGITGILSGGGLEYLYLASIKCIEEKGLAAIGSGFAANLKILDFYKCRFVTDDVILSISKGCPLLQEWDLSLCDHIGTFGWDPIGLYCKNLEKLHVNGCHNFHDNALLALGNGCKRLLVVYMINCLQVTSSGKHLLKKQRADVTIEERKLGRLSTVIP